MLQDLLSFSQKAEQEETVKDKKQDKSVFNLDASRINTISNVSNQLSIMEKIRQQKEQEEAKRKAIEKFLPKKKKKVSVEKFLQRELDYEQKKQYNIEIKRFKQRDEEKKNMREKPQLTQKSLDIAKSKNNPPLYTRTNEEIEKQKATIESLRKLYTQQLEEKEGKTCLTTGEGKENNKKRNRTEYSAERFNTWMEQQKEWKKKVDKKNLQRSSSLVQQDKSRREETYHPQISQGSLNIMKSCQTQPGNLRSRQEAFERLYNWKGKKSEKEMLQINNLPTFTPKINKRKYRNIMPRYYPDLTSQNTKTTETIIQNRKKRKMKPKSVDRRKKEVEEIDVMDIGQRRKVESVDHWSNTLLKMGKRKNKGKSDLDSVELFYKMNVRNAAAWNENDVNTVPLMGESKNIIKQFL